MAQDVVTAREVAAPAEVSLQFQDAELICEAVNDALQFHGFHRALYSEPTQSLLRLAWAVASHKHSRQVTVYHLGYALVCQHPTVGKELAECLRCDAESFAVGCILRLLPLGLSISNTAIVRPSVDAARWLGEAGVLAQQRDEQNELQPEDLVRAVRENTIPHSVRVQLRTAARLGGARRDAVLGPRPVQSPLLAPSSPREIIKQMEEVEKGRALAGPTDELTNLVELLEEFEQRHNADVADQKQALARIEAMIGEGAAPTEQRALHIDDILNKLGKIDHRVGALDDALPRPLSTVRLAAAIVAVLTLGVAVGLTLTLLPPGLRISQFVSVSAK